MNFRRAAIGSLSLLMLTPLVAHAASPPARKIEAPECRDLPRHGSRIKKRLCGAPAVLDRYERERNELITLASDRAFPPNGVASTRNTME